MWFLLAMVAAAIVWLLAIVLEFLPPPHAKMIIRVYGDQLRVTRGQLRAEPREFISEILRQTAMQSGFIAVTYYNRVSFSRNIPGGIRQRLRNVLLNTP